MITLKTMLESYENACRDTAKIQGMRTMVNHLCRAYEVDGPEGIASDRFWDIERSLLKHLRSSGVNLSKKSRREYLFRLRTLMRHARDAGIWTQEGPVMSDEWKQLAEEGEAKIHHIAYWAIMKAGKFAATCGYSPRDCDAKFWESYFQYLCSPIGGIEKPRVAYNRAIKALQALRPDDFPEERFFILPSKVNASYKVPVSKWSKELAHDIDHYRKWSTAPYSEGRPRRCKQKTDTNASNIRRLERYVGHLHHHLGIPIENIGWDVLLDYQNILSYMEYLDRENRPNSANQMGYLRMFRSIAFNFLPLALGRKCRDADAINEILCDYVAVPHTRPVDFADRYQEVLAIADAIMHTRQKYEAKNRQVEPESWDHVSERTIAGLYMKELLVRLALSRPLRSGNFSSMMIGENLILKNGRYMLHFEKDAIKRGNYIKDVEFPFPLPLVPLLEEFLVKQRPLLLGGRETKLLFVSRVGTALCKHQIRTAFNSWSMKVHGKPLTTHHLRHIAATGYLHRHPGDYLSLQKMLMHRQLQTTLQIYSQFNETSASRNFDAFTAEVEQEMAASRPVKTGGKKKTKPEITAAMQLVLGKQK